MVYTSIILCQKIFQVESIKSKLISEAENISTELEKFELRWQRSRPKETDLVDGNYSVIDHNIKILKEKREEWNKISESIQRVRYVKEVY